MIDRDGGAERGQNGLVQNVRTGVIFGFFGAAGFTVIVILLAVLMRSNPFESYGISFTRGVIMYFATLVPVGAVAGAMLPIARWTPGVICIGAVGGALVDIGCGIGMNGLHFWGPGEWFPLVGFAVFGAGLAPILRRSIRRGTERGEAWKRPCVVNSVGRRIGGDTYRVVPLQT